MKFRAMEERVFLVVVLFLIVNLLSMVTIVRAEDFFVQGNIFYKAEKYGEALTSYNKAIEANTNDTEARNNRGCAFAKLGELDKALADFSWGVEKKLNDKVKFYFYFNRALTLFEIDEENKAVDQDLEKLMVIDPKKAKSLIGAMEYVIVEKRIKTAEKIPSFKKVEKSSAQKLKTCVDYALEASDYEEPGKYHIALRLLDEAVKCDPRNGVFHHRKGEIFVKISKYSKAIEEYKLAIKYSPKEARFWKYYGGAYYRQGNYSQARAIYEEATKKFPNNASLFYALGEVDEKMGRLKYAWSNYASAVKLDPDNRNYRFAKIGMLVELSKRVDKFLWQTFLEDTCTDFDWYCDTYGEYCSQYQGFVANGMCN